MGWLREVLVPGVMLQQVLQGHPGYALRLRYKTSSSNVAFASGAPQPGAQSNSVDLHNGWTVRTFGPTPAGADVLTDGDALALLIVGSLLSVLLGLLVFILGAGRPAASAGAERPASCPTSDLYDALTGLPNRALMLDRAERMLARAGRQSGLLVGALFIDIDWFKDVNEKLGESAGDQLLRIVAERLEGVVRAHDTVGRLGGDEFVVLVESAARGVRLDSLARRVIEALHKPVELDGFGPSFAMTASIGVAFGRYATPDDLLRDAQLALHAAQAAGRDRYTLFNANMRSVIEGRGVLEVELNAALQDQQFFLLYQPIYDLRTQSVVGLEALIRWQHPTQGVLPPDDFIQLAEETGLIVPIGRWALEEACIRAAAWNVAGHRGRQSRYKVSDQSAESRRVRHGRPASAAAVRDRALVAHARGRRDHGDARRRGGSRAPGRDQAAGRAHRDRQLRQRLRPPCRPATGAARLPEGRPELARRLGRRGLPQLAAPGDPDRRAGPLAAGDRHGIETYEQMTTLQEMGCPMAQGFFMGRPTPTEAVEGLFDTRLPTAPTPATAPTSLID